MVAHPHETELQSREAWAILFGVRPKVKTLLHVAIVASTAAFLFQIQALARAGGSTWMLEAKYGIFLHYQYRILLGYLAGLNGYMKEPKVLAGLMDQATGRGELNEKTPGGDTGASRT